jgi:predicted  nucleic acid-binding Zn-ribbon protein
MGPLVIHLPRRPEVRDVRCECAVCGTHATGWQGHTLSASCDNCGSYEMRLVPPAPPAREDRGLAAAG